MNAYQQEQSLTLNQIRGLIESLDARNDQKLLAEIHLYLEFRTQLENFLESHFGQFCTRSCYERQVSACCGKDGIITFWADHVINVLFSDKRRLDDLGTAIARPLYPNKCIYLGSEGCLWKIRPLGCALFLCDAVQADVFNVNPSLKTAWESLTQRAKLFRWPDRPVLFDCLEQIFMAAGCRSALMYINTSPGLLRVKQKAGNW